METRVTATLERAGQDRAPAKELVDDLVSSAELSECTCPDWCARDHDRD
jgi:hypothetical protein